MPLPRGSAGAGEGTTAGVAGAGAASARIGVSAAAGVNAEAAGERGWARDIRPPMPTIRARRAATPVNVPESAPSLSEIETARRSQTEITNV